MLNEICIMGRLTRDPELRQTPSNVPVASFSVAVDRDFGKDQDGNKQTDYFEVVAWRQTGEFVSKYFQKGSLIVVVGSMQSRRWTDKDGNKRLSWEIIAGRVYFGGSKRDNDTAGESAVPYSQSYSAPAPQPQGFTDIPDDENDGELPF
jgi:single-strand DNA-binding protein